MGKHRYNKAKRAMAKGTLHTLGKAFSLVIADNLANMKGMETTSSKAQAYGANGKRADLGYRVSPDPKTSHVVHIHFAPMGASSNPNKSFTDKQLQTKFRGNDAEYYDIDLKDTATDKRCMRKVSKPEAKREKWKEVGLP